LKELKSINPAGELQTQDSSAFFILKIYTSDSEGGQQPILYFETSILRTAGEFYSLQVICEQL